MEKKENGGKRAKVNKYGFLQGFDEVCIQVSTVTLRSNKEAESLQTSAESSFDVPCGYI